MRLLYLNKYTLFGVKMATSIIATGSQLPKRIVKNEEIEKELMLKPGWIKHRCGVVQRHFLDNESFLDMAVLAAKNALEKSPANANDIDLIILATTTPQQIMPSTAVLIQHSLGIEHCMAFDLQAACSGFVYGLHIADSMMQASNFKYAMVLGCDAFSKIVNPADPMTSILFGDGFGAVVLENNQQDTDRGIFYKDSGSGAQDIVHLNIPWGVAQGFNNIAKISPYVAMNGREVFKSAVLRFTNEVEKALTATKIRIEDVRFIITHQANVRIIEAVCKNLHTTLDKFVITVSQHGNTSAASIPLALDQLFDSGQLVRGDILMLTGFGAGFTWGTIMLQH